MNDFSSGCLCVSHLSMPLASEGVSSLDRARTELCQAQLLGAQRIRLGVSEKDLATAMLDTPVPFSLPSCNPEMDK